MLLTVSIPHAFRPYLELALTRFGYLYPALETSVEDGDILKISAQTGSPLDPITARRDFLHLLYREKIYAETLDLRRSLYEGLLR